MAIHSIRLACWLCRQMCSWVTVQSNKKKGYCKGWLYLMVLSVFNNCLPVSRMFSGTNLSIPFWQGLLFWASFFAVLQCAVTLNSSHSKSKLACLDELRAQESGGEGCWVVVWKGRAGRVGGGAETGWGREEEEHRRSSSPVLHLPTFWGGEKQSKQQTWGEKSKERMKDGFGVARKWHGGHNTADQIFRDMEDCHLD